MSLHKHHLLQVQEQIVFFLWSSSGTAPGRGAGPGARAGRALLSSPGAAAARHAGRAGSPPWASPGGRELLNALPNQGAHLPLVSGARAQPADRRTQPGPSRPPLGAPAPCGRSRRRACSLCSRGPRLGPRRCPAGRAAREPALMGGTCPPSAIRPQTLNCPQKGRHSSSSAFAWRGTR